MEATIRCKNVKWEICGKDESEGIYLLSDPSPSHITMLGLAMS